MTDRTPPPPPTFAQLEENVRQRLVAHGQHGALAEFGKYTAAVQAECKEHHDAGFRRGQREGMPGETSRPAAVPTSAPKAKAPRKAKAAK